MIQAKMCVATAGHAIGIPWVFVHPWQYRAAVRALVGHQLLASHVIVAESLEHLVEESLSDIGRGVWARSRAELQWPAGGDSDKRHPSQDGEGTLDSYQHFLLARPFCQGDAKTLVVRILRRPSYM